MSKEANIEIPRLRGALSVFLCRSWIPRVWHACNLGSGRGVLDEERNIPFSRCSTSMLLFVSINPSLVDGLPRASKASNIDQNGPLDAAHNDDPELTLCVDYFIPAFRMLGSCESSLAVQHLGTSASSSSVRTSSRWSKHAPSSTSLPAMLGQALQACPAPPSMP